MHHKHHIRNTAACIAAAALLLTGCGGGPAHYDSGPHDTEVEAAPGTVVPPASAGAGPAATPAEAGGAGGAQSSGDLKIVADFKDGFKFHRVYAVAPGVKGDAQVAALLTRLHKQQPDAWWWLYDSDEKADVLAKTLPKTAQGDTKDYPAAWVQDHTTGHLDLTVGNGKKWIGYSGYDTDHEVVTLPYNGEYG